MRLRSQPGVPVLEVALGVGFGSAEAFARAFRARFGCSPTAMAKEQARIRGPARPVRPRKRERRKNGGSRKPETAMKVKLIDREPVHVAYLRLHRPLWPAIGEFWMETVAPWMGTNNLFGRERFGISLDDPSVTKPAQCRYDACVQSPDGEVLTGNPQRKVIPGGKYAALAFEGTGAPKSARPGMRCCATGCRKSGLQLDSRPFFEHYPVDGQLRREDRRFSCNICVPVAHL